MLGTLMASKEVTVDFECWNCRKQNVQTVKINTNDDTGSLNIRRRSIDVTCDNPGCGKTNSVDVNV